MYKFVRQLKIRKNIEKFRLKIVVLQLLKFLHIHVAYLMKQDV